jgi:hypothetical protein
MGPICSSETSVSKRLAPRNNEEDQNLVQSRRKFTIIVNILLCEAVLFGRYEPKRQMVVLILYLYSDGCCTKEKQTQNFIYEQITEALDERK